MALLFCDGFDDGLMTTKWLPTGSVSTTLGRTGNAGQCPGAAGSLTKGIVPSSTIVVGFACRLNYFGTAFAAVYTDNLSTRQIQVKTTPLGTIQLQLGTSGVVLGTSGVALTLNTWHYLELKVTIADSGGNAAVRVDGVERINFTGDTRNGGTSTLIDAVQLHGGSNTTPAFDDLYIVDTNGSVNNDFLGDIRIETLYPNANGSSSQFVGSDGDSIDNYQLVNEAGAPNTTNYVSSSTVGQKDTYGFTDLSATSGSVKGVQVSIYAVKTDSGVRDVRSVVRSGAVEAYGTTSPLQMTHNTHLHIQETDPATGAPWSISAVNTAEFGIDVSA